MRRVLLLALIWGWSFLFIKVAVAGMTPTTVAGARVFLGMIVVLPVLRARGLRLPRDRMSWRHFTVMALLHSVLPFSVAAWGIERITSELAAVVNASTGIFAALAAALFLGERLRGSQLFGMALGFVGVGLAAGFGTEAVTGSTWTGALATLSATACYGLGYAYAQHHLTTTPVLVAAGGQLVMATLLGAPGAILTSVRHGLVLTPTRALAIILLGMVGTGYAYLLNYRSIAELGSTRTSLVTYFVVVVAIAVGVVFLDEPFTAGLVIGAALVVLGVLLVQDRIRRFRPAPIVAALLALFFLGACAGEESHTAGSTTTSAHQDAACGPAVEEQLDPNSARHLLPGAAEPKYLSDPPTSGAHRSGGAPSGALDTVLDRPVQVQLLERGAVLLQYRNLTPTERGQLERLAGLDVVVAPNPTLPDRVVATAWLHKQLCSGIDEDELRKFIVGFRGKTGASHSS